MDDFWRQRIRATWLGLGHLTFGASIMAFAISNAEHSVWSLPQFAFGGAIVTQGFLHLTTAWNIHPPADQPPVANGIVRVGIPLAPIEEGAPDLVVEGLILHQNSPPIAEPDLGDRINDVGEVDPENVEEADPANAVDEVRRAKVEEVIPEIIVDEPDQEIDTDGESGNTNNAGELGPDNDACEAQSANVVHEAGPSKGVDDAKPANAINAAGPANDICEVNQEDLLDDIAKCVDEEDSADESQLEIEIPRSFMELDVPSIKFIDSSESDCESIESSY